MKKVLMVGGIVALVAILGAAVVGTAAFAQEPENGDGWPFNFREKFNEAVAGILGIEVDEYTAAVEQAQGQVVDEALAEGWLTEDQAERMRERMEEGVPPRGGPRSPHDMGKSFMKRGVADPVGVAAEALAMTPAELMTELKSGKSITEVAGEEGVDPQAIVDAYVAKLAETLAQAVENGRITQKQADAILEKVEEQGTDLLDKKWEGPSGRLPAPRGWDKDFGTPHGWDRGFKAPRGGMMNPLSVAAGELGMTPDELLAELQDGQSIAQVAKENGVEPQAIVDAYVDKLSEALSQAVENGRLSQEQADTILKKVEEQGTDLLEKTWQGRPGRFPGSSWPGGMRSFPSLKDA